MLNRIFFALLFVGLCSSGSSLNCKWMEGKFKELNKEMLDLLRTMANNSTNTTEEGENTVAFPHKLYSHASNASATDKLAFVVQTLEETAALFEEDHSAASWEDSTVDKFLTVVNRQADELSSCIGSHKKKNTKLHMHFKRLSGHILKKMGHSADAWELIRTKIEFHLISAHLLASSLRTAN
uniref:Interferon a3-like n=1 Tax=Acanthochromis polyacanthus TaxID=80966 RepID=A0A3Q1GRP4_9TELE